MRAIWNGMISFGLVNIPVGLFTAVKNVLSNFISCIRRIKVESAISASVRNATQKSSTRTSSEVTSTKRAVMQS